MHNHTGCIASDSTLRVLTRCSPPVPSLPCLQFGVFLPDVELFDAELFSVMRTEAVTMDPQQRLLLHAAHESLAQGGGAAAAFGRAVGAFVGIAGGYWWAV